MSDRKRIARARRNAFRTRMFRESWNTCREEAKDFFTYYVLTPFGIMAVSAVLGISICLITMVCAAESNKDVRVPQVTEYLASEYDIEAMADRLNLEPVYINCDGEARESRIVETHTMGGTYSYKYEVYVTGAENAHLWDDYKLNRDISE